MWWNKPGITHSYVKYKIDQTEVLVGGRLDFKGCDPNFFKSVDGWLVVTESWIPYPLSANVRWFPWKELSENFPDTVLFGTLKTLHHWIKDLKISRIYLHCDGGTHRAPSTLGAFLKAYYSPQEAQTIINQREVIHNELSGYVGANGEFYPHPLEYVEGKMMADPKLPFLIKAIVENPDSDLDTICRSLLKMYLPDNLLSPEELAERTQLRSNQEFFQQQKKLLNQEGFQFSDSPYGEFDALYQGNPTAIFLINPQYPYNPQVFINIKLRKGLNVLVVGPTSGEVFSQTTFPFSCTTWKQHGEILWAWAKSQK